MTDSLSPTKLGELKRLEIRYHGAMPNWVKIIGLKIKAVHECEGGGFCVDKAQGEAIVAAESEVSRLTAELVEVRADLTALSAAILGGGSGFALIEAETLRQRADTLAAENAALRQFLTAMNTTLQSEETMRAWDRWRGMILDMPGASLPRDAFEVWLSSISVDIEAALSSSPERLPPALPPADFLGASKSAAPGVIPTDEGREA